MMHKNILSLIIAIQFLSCARSSVPLAIQSTNTPHHKTIISGRLVSNPTWFRQTPAIVIKDGYEKHVYYGEIIKQTQKGFIFVRNADGWYEPEPKEYLFDEIVGIIDNDLNTLYGKMPDEFSYVNYGLDLQLKPINGDTYSSIRLIMLPNEIFSYAIAPGIYTVEKILFFGTNASVYDIAIDQQMKINIQKDKINDIGTIYLDCPTKDSTRSIHLLSSKKYERNLKNIPLFGPLHYVTTKTIYGNEIVDNYRGKRLHILQFGKSNNVISVE
ncbi:hypothetical protein JNM05_15925 [bacterium]|nr:hypothetical protein [bacterium]